MIDRIEEKDRQHLIDATEECINNIDTMSDEDIRIVLKGLVKNTTKLVLDLEKVINTQNKILEFVTGKQDKGVEGLYR